MGWRGVLLCLLLAGCGEGKAEPAAEGTVEPVAAPSASEPAAPTSANDADRAGWQACAGLIAEAKVQPAAPGAPGYEKVRVHMARVRGRALLWRRAFPRPAGLGKILAENDTAPKVAVALRELIRKTKDIKARRALLLREGYLWDDDVHMALALTEQVSLPALFDDGTLYIQRGVEIWELSRVGRTRYKKERYLYKDGPLVGEQAEILLGDRVATDRGALGDDTAVAIDLHDLLLRERFDRIKPVHLGASKLVAELRYGPGVWVPALIEIRGQRADVACWQLDEDLVVKKRSFADATAVLHGAMDRVRAVIRDMVREEIPFDADQGQTMGFLRKEWKRAYLKGIRRFDYEGEVREVYNTEGKPIPPQVCIDFLTDVWERASGTWYAPANVVEGLKGKKKLEPSPRRTKGSIDFDALVENRRSVAEFAKFTSSKTDLFDVWELPRDERYPFKERERFFNYLHDKADMFRVGDMITLHGYKEGGRPHYHSLIVLEQDPITGVITRIAGNAVFPREQTLEGIMYISPKRSIRHRIRVKEPWLKLVAEAGKEPLGG